MLKNRDAVLAAIKQGLETFQPLTEKVYQDTLKAKLDNWTANDSQLTFLTHLLLDYCYAQAEHTDVADLAWNMCRALKYLRSSQFVRVDFDVAATIAAAEAKVK